MEQLNGFLQGEPLDLLNESQMFDDVDTVNLALQSFVDLYVNELNINYIHNETLLDNINGAHTWMCLRSAATNSFMESISVINANPKLMEVKPGIMMELMRFYECMFPPCLLKGVRAEFEETLKKEKDNRISALVDAIKKEGKEPAAEESLKEYSSQDLDDLFARIKNILLAKGEPTTEANVNKHMSLIKDDPYCKRLYDLCGELERQKVDIEVNDFVTNKKNEVLEVPLSAGTDDCYNAYGMCPASLDKLFPK